MKIWTCEKCGKTRQLYLHVGEDKEVFITRICCGVLQSVRVKFVVGDKERQTTIRFFRDKIKNYQVKSLELAEKILSLGRIIK
jgi:hypothetical protein